MRVVGRGAAVVVDPANGNVLAMVSVPSFDPNDLHPQHQQRGLRASSSRTTPTRSPTAPSSPTPRAAPSRRSRASRASSWARATTSTPARAASPTAGATCTAGSARRAAPTARLDLEGGLKNSCNAYFFQYGNAAGVDAIDKVAGRPRHRPENGHRTLQRGRGHPPGQGMVRHPRPARTLDRRPHRQPLHRPGFRPG